MRFRTLVILCALPLATAVAKQDVDFSKYEVPLYDQVASRIRADIAPRLGKGRLQKERYFMIPFAYQDKENNPEMSHSFITVIRVFATDKTTETTPELPTREYKDWEFEAFTISWLPADFMENPHLCVFDGPGARLFASENKCPVSEGKNFNLKDTLKLAADARNAVAMWGPYEIAKPGFDLGVARMRLLDSGEIKYRADDRLYQKDKVAISCFHAMAGLDEIHPKGGFLGTGLKMWGFNGTARVLIEYNDKAHFKKLLMDPVDVKKDRSGFVYAPTANGPVPYNPLAEASAYHF
jgi:hypothetical protein